MFTRIVTGEIVGRLTDVSVFEAVFTLERSYKQTKAAIRVGLLQVIDEPNLLMANKTRWRRILEMYETHDLPLGDAMQVDAMQRLGLTEIISWDKDFDRVPGITRIEP
jgi:predicted nucleic acid-binding protein